MFFYSAAVALFNIIGEESCSKDSVTSLENMGINNTMSVSNVAQRLRELIVTEWTSNPERY